MDLQTILTDDRTRRELFPVTDSCVFMAHAGVCPLPAPAAAAMRRFVELGTQGHQEQPEVWDSIKRARQLAAQLIGADQQEIALVGPTSLGLNLVAHGVDWNQGDEVVYCSDDYPANVYAWMELEKRGVKPVAIRPEQMGIVTWDLIEPALTDKTRMVTLASCGFISGYQLDIDDIGRRLHERGILFCVDAIQTLGMHPLSVQHVDFLAADSHKWMLGPTAAGIFYVARELHNTLRPAILGAWNVVSPGFIAQDKIDFYPGARQYESGCLNGAGISGMAASLKLLLDIGVDAISKRLLQLRKHTIERMGELDYEVLIELDDDHACAIITFTHPSRDLKADFDYLEANRVIASQRHDRDMTPVLRLSPHLYNTEQEVDRVVELLAKM